MAKEMSICDRCMYASQGVNGRMTCHANARRNYLSDGNHDVRCPFTHTEPTRDALIDALIAAHPYDEEEDLDVLESMDDETLFDLVAQETSEDESLSLMEEEPKEFSANIYRKMGKYKPEDTKKTNSSYFGKPIPEVKEKVEEKKKSNLSCPSRFDDIT